MFTFTQILVSRPQFILEKLDARRLLSVSVAVDATSDVEATEVTEVVADPTMIEQTVIDGDVLMFKGDEGEMDPSIYETQILTMEEPVENLEDIQPPDCYEVFDGEIRYTMMPAENERNLDEPVDVEILTLEEPLENLEDTPSGGIDGEILTFGGEGDLDDPNAIFYSMGSPTGVGDTGGSTELPPPPSQSSAFASAPAGKSLSDDVLELTDGNVLA